MAHCKYCGGWSGLFDKEHTGCAEGAAQGLSPDQLYERVFARRPRSAVWNTAWGVFIGLWLFSVTAGIVYALIRLITSPS